MFGKTLVVCAILTAVVLLPAGCHHGAKLATADRCVQKAEVIEERWPDGELRLRKQMRRNEDGELVNHGTYKRWYDNGQQEYQATFVDGKIHGLAVRWHRSGRKWIEEHFADGTPHGSRRIWDENGVKRKEEHHVHGEPRGTWTVWDKHGKVKIQRNFGADKP